MSELKNTKQCLETIKDIRSILKYEKKPVPREVLNDIIDCARMAPTARNIQPWEFVVVTAENLLNTLSEFVPRGEFIKDAPAAIVVFSHKNTEYFLEDCTAATQNILIAARFHGLKTCWIAGYQGSYYEKDNVPMCEGIPCTPIPDLFRMQRQIRELLGVPKDFELISVVSMGYSDENPEAKKRSLEDVMHVNRYGEK